MKLKMLSGMVILACVTALVALSGCTANTIEGAKEAAKSSPQISAPTILNDGVLTVGVIPDNAPFTMSSTNGGVEGIDLDLASAIADTLGLDVAFVEVDDASAVTDGQVDVVMGMLTSDASIGQYVVVGRAITDAPGLFSLNATGETTTTTGDELSGKSVGVQEGSVSASKLAELAPSAVQTDYPNLNDAMAALANGDVEYVACDSLAGGYLAAPYGNISYAGALAVPEAYGVAVAESDTDLQESIQTVLDSISAKGVLSVILHKWVGDMPLPSTEYLVTAETSDVVVDETDDTESTDEDVAADDSGDSAEDDEKSEEA